MTNTVIHTSKNGTQMSDGNHTYHFPKGSFIVQNAVLHATSTEYKNTIRIKHVTPVVKDIIEDNSIIPVKINKKGSK